MRLRVFLVLLLSWGLARGAATQNPPPGAVRLDTLPLKDPKGPHQSEACRYNTEPFVRPPDPEHAEAQCGPAGFGPLPGTGP